MRLGEDILATARKILIVDDEQDLLDALAQLLELKSYSVFATTEGRKAIEACQSEKFDVILSHWFDRRENIAEMLETIKKQSPETKQVIMTGSLTLNPQLENEYSVIYKPFTVDDLVVHIEQLFLGN